MKKIAFVYTWPNTPFKNAEYEVLKRVEIAAKNIGQELDIISSNGYILDEEYYETSQRVIEDDYEFMVSVHYDDIKKLDIFSYYTLWVPPEISLQYDVYPHIKKNILSNDDYLIYDDGGQKDHLETILMDSPRDLENCSELYATPPVSALIEPQLKNPLLFYCGINWEKLIGVAPRHAGLFDLLEQVDWINIFGPESTWKGCKRYKGKIPFDGVSMLKEINNSGVVLAISSDVHYRAGSVTNRIYEAAAGGAVIISDTNPWVIKLFGDSVLYFDYDKKNPQKMFEQIKKHMEWIKENKEEALKLAQRSQQIFKNLLGQEKQLQALIDNHRNRKVAVEKALYSKEPNKKTLAVLFLDNIKWEDSISDVVLNTIDNIERQFDKNIVLHIIANSSLCSNISNIIKDKKVNFECKIKNVEFYDEFGNKKITRGQECYRLINDVKHDYLMLLHGTEYLFRDHVTTLKRSLEDNSDASIAYSGLVYEDDVEKFGYVRYEKIPASYLLSSFRFYPNGSFLIKSDIEKYVPKYVYSNIDGTELMVLVNVAHFKHKEKIVFSKRVTAREQKKYSLKNNPALPISYQENMIKGMNLFELEELNSNGIVLNTENNPSKDLNKFINKKYRHHLIISLWYQRLRRIIFFTGKKRERVLARIKHIKSELNKTKNYNILR